MDSKYTKKTIKDLEVQIQQLGTKLTGGQWSDFSETDPGYVLMKIMASMTDMINVNIDFKYWEMFLETARLRSSVQSLLELNSYGP